MFACTRKVVVSIGQIGIEWEYDWRATSKQLVSPTSGQRQQLAIEPNSLLANGLFLIVANLCNMPRDKPRDWRFLIEIFDFTVQSNEFFHSLPRK